MTRRTAATGISPAIEFAALAALLAAAPAAADKATWRLGDGQQPWRLHPVSQVFDVGEVYRPDYAWGGSHAAEIAVDDDGDGAIDEDPVDLIDDDGDGLINEDPVDGEDDDRDGLTDEDGPDGQRDNDGDGLLNEDGRHTGGVFWDPTLSQVYALAPFFRLPTPDVASGDPANGYGYGDDDLDGSFNEDPVDGIDNDGDGLVDEDGEAPPIPLPSRVRRVVFRYDPGTLTDDEAVHLVFRFDAEQEVFLASDGRGGTVVATPETQELAPTDWLRPVRLDSLRNLSRVMDDRFLSGIYGNRDPFDTARFGAERGSSRHGDTGYGQIVDGDIFSARGWSDRTENTGFRVELLGAYGIDLLRLRPRPDFPDRSPASFQIHYAGDDPDHVQTRLVGGVLQSRLLVNDFIIPRQVDRTRPAIKEFRFDGGELGPPPTVRALDLRGDMDSGVPWEIAEFEVFGSGYSHEASLVSEIVDLGRADPVIHRFFAEDDPSRPLPLEWFTTRDIDGDRHIDADELAQTALARQIDFDAPGGQVIIGDVRWRLQTEGAGALAHLRVRSGTAPDTRIYQRGISPELRSPFVEAPILLDWPARGSRLDVYSYTALSEVQRASFKTLPLNEPGAQDGMGGGWTPWSSPLELSPSRPGEVTASAAALRLPLSRYVQFRVDFSSGPGRGTAPRGGAAVDFIEIDYGVPVAGRGIRAEIFPTRADLGVTSSYTLALLPEFEADARGFNRVDVAMPSRQARLLAVSVDDAPWTRIDLSRELQPAAALAALDLEGRGGSYAAAVYADDSADGMILLSIKTPTLGTAEFPPGQGRTIELTFETPVFQALTEFPSWLWTDADPGALKQRAEAGDASQALPADAIDVFAVGAADPGVRLLLLTPNPFSPNGDGINDIARFDLQALSFLGPAQLQLHVHALSGRRVHGAVTGMVGAGEASLHWDGRDSAGHLCPPGLYLYRISLRTPQRELAQAASGTIALAY